MSDGRGYLVPDEPQPEGLKCIVVFYPDDILYKQALMGALQYFTQWTAWNRDADHKGLLAGEAWRLAYEETENSMGCLNELADSVSEVALAISGLNMGGGASCCSPATETIGNEPSWLNDGQGQVGDLNNPQSDPVGWDEVENGVYDAYKCSVANAIVDDWISTMAKMSTVGGMVSAMGAAAVIALFNSSMLSGLIVGLMTVGLSASGAVVVLIGAFVTIILGGVAVLAYWQDMASSYDRQKAVCDLYNASTSQIAKAAMEANNAIAAANLAGDGVTIFATGLASVAGVLLPDVLFDALFDAIDHVSSGSPVMCACGLVPETGWYEITLDFNDIEDMTYFNRISNQFQVPTMANGLHSQVHQVEPFPQNPSTYEVTWNSFWSKLGYSTPVDSSCSQYVDLTQRCMVVDLTGVYTGDQFVQMNLQHDVSTPTSGLMTQALESQTILTHRFALASPVNVERMIFVRYSQSGFYASNEARWDTDYIKIKLYYNKPL